ncbi:flagellar hook capping FlgD N-terminal domain-containing protein [Halocella sp. SP3-1]|uniref:flagellar hook capping FlgD N-terminal domain-containing protein n=1 Tax=Halocella sp. SP3-1 TaxID=2382161 RepID=UPI000F75E20E|nr:flagellar hook capping FlgD N-terminal domain-containing protein [Halocella sp. SP3-1]AZO94043.1 flagellar hook capping protein [Halocella sp. SP3-1]
MSAPSVNVDPTNNNYSSSNQVKREDSNDLDRDAFFKLLTTQMTYQDPLNPMDNTQFISQMAQFSSLEQMENMNANMTQFLRIQGLSEGASLIGKTVETIDPETGETIKGEVVKVTFEDGNMYAYFDEKTKVDVDGITAIYEEKEEEKEG